MTNKEAKAILEFFRDNILNNLWFPNKLRKRLPEALDLAIKALQERLQGKWIYIGGDEWCCSECGHVITTEGNWETPLDREKYHCTICGADMRKGDET